MFRSQDSNDFVVVLTGICLTMCLAAGVVKFLEHDSPKAAPTVVADVAAKDTGPGAMCRNPKCNCR